MAQSDLVNDLITPFYFIGQMLYFNEVSSRVLQNDEAMGIRKMKQNNSIFFFSQTYYWFDGEGVNYESIEIFEDGSISTIDFADERIPTEIKKEWKSNEKLAEEIKQILSRISIALEGYDFEDYEKHPCRGLLANLIEESYRFDNGNKEFTFYYKWNNISSEYFIKKAPFTLLVKQIQEKIKLEYPEFEMINVQ